MRAHIRLLPPPMFAAGSIGLRILFQRLLYDCL
jgi:hypothetical protein